MTSQLALNRLSAICLICVLFFAAAGSPLAATVRISNKTAGSSARNLGGIDYGSFSVVEVDDATADKLVQIGAGERVDDANRIFLNAETVDTTAAVTQSLRQAVGDFSGKHLHLVQFAGPIKQEWVDALVADGLRIVTYIPNNAYLVWGNAGSVANLQARANDVSAAVRWEVAWQDQWKVTPNVLGNSKNGAQPTNRLSVQLVEDKETNEATLAALQGAGATFLRKPWTSQGYLNFAIRLDPSSLSVLTAQPDVVSVHRYEEPKMRDESQSMVLAGNLTGNVPNSGDYLTTLANWGFTQAQFDASGLAVDVSDDGVDNGTTTPNHFVLYRNGDNTQASRFIYRITQGTAGTDGGVGNSGHGQLNTSIIGGFVPSGSITVNGNTTSTTTFPHADAQGFRYGLGVAPFVKLGNSTIFDPDFTNPTYSTLQSAAYAAGARVSSNSWGSNVAGDYDSDSQAYDALVRDAQSGSAGNQQMVIVFSAGNSGPASQTIGSPGTGKNVITVGAAEGVRSHNIPAGGTDASGNDGCGIPDSQANSANDMATFSSRGPCADGRFKPDLVAGGTHITGMTFVTADSTLNGTAVSTYRADGVCGLPGNSAATGQVSDFFPTVNGGAPPYNQAQQWWTTSSGTSHSCPAVSGAAALVFQQVINNPPYLATNRVPAGAAPPSPALVKAYLMNSARYMTGTGANDVFPSNSQGMGHANLGTAFDGVTRIIRDQVPADGFTATGQTRTFTGLIADTSKPFRVTLAWTDPVGPTTGNAYVNNLDLTVTVGGNTYKGNVFGSGGVSITGGSSDTRNNVESVFLPSGNGCSFSITVTATNIAGVADPTVAGNNQDFALVVYNGNSVATPVLSGNTPLFGGASSLQPNDCNTLTIPVTNNGSGGATAVSAVLSTSTTGVTVTQPNSAYPDLDAGATGPNSLPFQVSTASSVPCGTLANFTLTVTYTGGCSPAIFNFSLPVGASTLNYVFTPSTGASIPGGGTLVAGSQADDALASITTPAGFDFSVYGTAVPGGSTISASTNGNLQIASTGTNAYLNAALPISSTAGVGVSGTFPPSLPTIFAYWDDLNLPSSTPTNGIYTSLTGSAPNRVYTIEWRGALFSPSTTTIDFAVQFHENSSAFDLIYLNATGASGASATIGVQAASTGTQFTQFSFNTTSISSGTKLSAALPVCISGSGPCGTVAPNITSSMPPNPVTVGSPYMHAFTATGSPAPTFAVTAGTLPMGLTLTPDGVLSGTVTDGGTGSFPNITVTATNGIAPDAMQAFSLSVVTLVNNYIASFGLTGSDALPLADPNGDGVPNLLAYALNFDPTANNGTFEQGMVRTYGGQNYLSIRFNRSALATDLTYIVEATEDLTGTWTELAHSTAGGALTATGGVVVSDSGGPPIYLDEVRDTVAVPSTPSDPQRFIRLRITSP